MCMVSAIGNFAAGLKFVKELVIQYDDQFPLGYSSKTTQFNSRGLAETVYIVPYVTFSSSLNGALYPEVIIQQYSYCPLYVTKVRHLKSYSLDGWVNRGGKL